MFYTQVLGVKLMILSFGKRVFGEITMESEEKLIVSNGWLLGRYVSLFWGKGENIFICKKDTCSLMVKAQLFHYYEKSESESRSVVSSSLQPHGLYSPRNSPGQNTGVGSYFLLQGIFPTQGSNPGLSHCRWILYQLSHKGSPRILKWVAYCFSSGSSRPRLQVDSLPTELYRSSNVHGGCT